MKIAGQVHPDRPMNNLNLWKSAHTCYLDTLSGELDVLAGRNEKLALLGELPNYGTRVDIAVYAALQDVLDGRTP